MDNNTYKLIKTIIIIAFFAAIIYYIKDGVAKMYHDFTHPAEVAGENVGGLISGVKKAF